MRCCFQQCGGRHYKKDYQYSLAGKKRQIQSDRMFVSELGLVPSDGKGKVQNLILSGYYDFSPKWTMKGKMEEFALVKELEKYSTASSRCSSRERLYLLSFR